MGRMQRGRQRHAAPIEGRTINRRARRKITGVVAIGVALAFSSLDISRHGPDGHAAWRVSLVSPAHAEQELVGVLIRVIEGATGSSGRASSSQPGTAGHLGMYVPSNVPGQPGSSDAWAIWGGGFYATGGPYLERSLVKGFTKSPSQRSTFSFGGIYGVYDASRFLPADQTLTLWGSLNIGQDNLVFGPLPGRSVSAGYDKFDHLYILSGYAKWTVGNAYLQGLGIGIFADGTQFSSDTGGLGSFTARDYGFDAKFGYVFVLYDGSTVSRSAAFPTKAPSRRTSGDNGYLVGLDLSGHVGYNDFLINGFTDSAGLIWGNTEAKFGIVGATAKLFATIPVDRFQWKPYASVAVDEYPGLQIDRFFPSQRLLPTGDVRTIFLAQTFWTGELGLDAQNDAGWTVGIKGLYMASSDTIVRYAGGFLRIPFNSAPTRY
jgi:hypothetical protein